MDARNSIFVMTSNIRLQGKKAQLGFGSESQAGGGVGITPELKKYFRAEFINRIDHTVVFRSLTEDDALSVARLIFSGIAVHLSASVGVHLSVTDEAMRVIVDKGHSKEFGVRHLRRVIEEYVEAPLARLVLKPGRHRARQVVIDVEGGEVVVRCREAPSAQRGVS